MLLIRSILSTYSRKNPQVKAHTTEHGTYYLCELTKHMRVPVRQPSVQRTRVSQFHERRSVGGQGDMSPYFLKWGDALCFDPLLFSGLDPVPYFLRIYAHGQFLFNLTLLFHRPTSPLTPSYYVLLRQEKEEEKGRTWRKRLGGKVVKYIPWEVIDADIFEGGCLPVANRF